MLVYNYDGITKEYLYSSEAYLDDLETIKQGREIYLIPANATNKRPLPNKEGYAQCFDTNSNNWFLLEDHRGEKVYSKEDLSELVIKNLGAIPNGYLLEKPKPKNKYQVWKDGKYTYPELDNLKISVKDDLDQEYQNKINIPHKVGKYYVQPSWATIYTNTLVAMQDDINADGHLDEVYKILLITDPLKGSFHHLQVNNIDEFMPYYKKVKEKYKQLTEEYHDKIIRIAKSNDAEVIVGIILNY